ncbi:MAG: 50S ribosomal protein L21 [Planctomycetota bacterium]
MYAIIVDGGRQYKVTPGMELDIDYREGVQADDELSFDRVLVVGSDDGLKLGTPVVEGASVTATVLGPKQGKKIYVQKFRRRKHSKRRTGHRQLYTRVRVEGVQGL